MITGICIAKWDPFNAVIVTEASGKIDFESVIENVTYKVESDEATGLREIIITESKDKNKIPSLHILDENGGIIRTYNLPVGGHVVVEDKQTVKAGDILVKIPRAVGKAGDITGGLPRVTELLEARNPSNPAVVSEIDGEVIMGKIKRGNREIIVTSKTGDVRKYLVALSKQILVQENDYVRAGTPLSDGAITPADILAIKGPTAVQEYIVNEIQDVYRLQGAKSSGIDIEPLAVETENLGYIDGLGSNWNVVLNNTVTGSHDFGVFIADDDTANNGGSSCENVIMYNKFSSAYTFGAADFSSMSSTVKNNITLN